MAFLLGLPVPGGPTRAEAAMVVPPSAAAQSGEGPRTGAIAGSSARRKRGALVVRVAGLPRRARPAVVVRGPRQSPRSGKRFRRVVRKVGTTRLRGLRPGRYRVVVRKARVKHRTGSIRRGAVAHPVKGRYRVGVRRGRGRVVAVRYGSIVNPGLRRVNGRISRVVGNPLRPGAILLRSARGIGRGKVLSARPSPRLPHGLLARVNSVAREKRGFRVRLRPVDIYDVAPNMRFSIRLRRPNAATASSPVSCGASGGASIDPYARVSDIRFSGGWTTAKVAFVEVTTGADVALTFRAAAGVSLNAAAAASCSVPLPAVALQGMAGPIPVYGAIRPQASAEIGGGVSLSAGGSTDVTLGARIGGVPPSAGPTLGFGSPSFDLEHDAVAAATARLGLDAEVGIGAANAANLHASFGNSLDFSAAPGACSWDLNLGSFSAGGQLGPFSISTPATPALYSRNLWRNACGAPPPPPPPVAVDSIAGTWEFPGIGEIRIVPTGAGSFHGIAVADIYYQDSSCLLTPAGEVVWPTIHGSGGDYTGNVYWAEVGPESCLELGFDPNGRFTVEGDTLEVCSQSPVSSHSGCFSGYRKT